MQRNRIVPAYLCVISGRFMPGILTTRVTKDSDCDRGVLCLHSPGKDNLSPEEEEIRRLHEENERLRMEKEFLRKAATAFFAKEGN